MAEASALYRVRSIDSVVGRYGYVGRYLGRSAFICERVRTAESRGCIAVAMDGMQPIRTLDPGECVWDVLANRIAVSAEHMSNLMMGAARALERETAYDAEQAGAELREAAVHMDGKVHIAIGGTK